MTSPSCWDDFLMNGISETQSRVGRRLLLTAATKQVCGEGETKTERATRAAENLTINHHITAPWPSGGVVLALRRFPALNEMPLVWRGSARLLVRHVETTRDNLIAVGHLSVLTTTLSAAADATHKGEKKVIYVVFLLSR